MDKNPPPTHLSFGGLIRFQIRPAHLSAWLAPTWATLCGLVASGNFGWNGADFLRLALLILLVDGGWGTLWSALGSTDWATPLRRWRDWHAGEPVAAPPYTLPGTPGDALSRWLGQLRAWRRDILWPACGPAITAIAVALPATAALAALLGPELVLASAAALALMQLGLAWNGGRGAVAPGWDALISITLPWLAGQLAFGELSLLSVALALVFTVAWGSGWQAGSAWGRFLNVGSQILAAVLLVAWHHPIAAMCLALFLAPQSVLLPWLQHGQPATWYLRYTRPWLMAAMLVTAWAL